MFGQLLGWTACAWENPSQEIHRMKEKKLPVLLMSGTLREYGRSDWQMAEWNLCCLHANEWARPTHSCCTWLQMQERLTAMLELVKLFSSTSRHPSECLMWTHSWQFLVFGRDPNHLLLLSVMQVRHMNIRPGCNVTVVIVVMTNCTHLPNLFARVGVLAVEHYRCWLGRQSGMQANALESWILLM